MQGIDKGRVSFVLHGMIDFIGSSQQNEIFVVQADSLKFSLAKGVPKFRWRHNNNNSKFSSARALQKLFKIERDFVPITTSKETPCTPWACDSENCAL